jgi:integrase
MVNGRSTFAPVAHSHMCSFDGQLKKRGKTVVAYTIPLLVPFSKFSIGLLALRQKQGDVRSLTNAQIKDRYGRNAQRELTNGAMVGMPRDAHLHDMRRVYIAYVAHLFNTPLSLNLLIQRCLGHESMSESHVYNHARLQKNAEALRGSLGPLHLP